MKTYNMAEETITETKPKKGAIARGFMRVREPQKPGKEFHKNHRPPHREYPIRLYKNHGAGLVWLTCDIKGRNKGL